MTRAAAALPASAGPAEAPRAADLRALDRAFAVLRAGDVETAERMALEALADAPEDPDALSLAGMAAQARGRHEAAIEHFAAVLKRIGRHPQTAERRARSLLALERRDEAIALLEQAVGWPGADAKVAELHAAALIDAGRSDDAAHAAGRARARFGPSPRWDFLNGRAAEALGALDAAEANYAAAAAADPNFAEAHRFLAALRLRRGDAAGAAGRLDAALAAAPDHEETWRHLALAQLAAGQPQAARDAAREALARALDPTPARLLMARALAALETAEPDTTLRDDLAAALSAKGALQSGVYRHGAALIRANAEIERLAALRAATPADALPPTAAILPPARRAVLLEIQHPVCAALLSRRALASREIEGALTLLRAGLLQLDAEGGLDIAAATAPFERLAALIAAQAELAQGLWPTTAAETARLAALDLRLAARLEDPTPLSRGDRTRFALRAAYGPLEALSAAAERLAALPARIAAEAGSSPLAEILRLHLIDPSEERRIAAALPAAEGAAAPSESRGLRPSPRWRELALAPRPTEGRRAADALGLPRVADAGAGRILVAGCGTGRGAIRTAWTNPTADVLAIDVARDDLAYGARIAAKIGLDRLSFQVADAGSLPDGLAFDEIHAGTALARAADPAAELAQLVRRMSPGGLIRLDLPSRAGHAPVADARAAYAGARPDLDPAAATAEDLRGFRAWALAQPEGAPARALATWPEFYALGALWDLVFPIRERLFDIPELAALLAEAGLAFRAFETAAAPALAAALDAAHPGRAGDLAAWAAVEAARPAAVGRSYRLWALKPR